MLILLLIAKLADTASSWSCTSGCLLLGLQTQPIPVHARLVASSWSFKNCQEWPQLLTSKAKAATAAYQQGKSGHSCSTASQEWSQLLNSKPRVLTAA